MANAKNTGLTGREGDKKTNEETARQVRTKTGSAGPAATAAKDPRHDWALLKTGQPAARQERRYNEDGEPTRPLTQPRGEGNGELERAAGKSWTKRKQKRQRKERLGWATKRNDLRRLEKANHSSKARTGLPRGQEAQIQKGDTTTVDNQNDLTGQTPQKR